MAKFPMPHDQDFDTCEAAAVKAWAMYFAHAKLGDAVFVTYRTRWTRREGEITEVAKRLYGRRVIQVTSQFSARWCGTCVFIDADTGETIWDRSEQYAVKLLTVAAEPTLRGSQEYKGFRGYIGPTRNKSWLDEARSLGHQMAIDTSAVRDLYL